MDSRRKVWMVWWEEGMNGMSGRYEETVPCKYTISAV